MLEDEWLKPCCSPFAAVRSIAATKDTLDDTVCAYIQLAVLPCVYGAASITLPCIIVADVVDDYILIWLGCQDVPSILVMQVVISSIVQNGRISLLQADHTKSIVACIVNDGKISLLHSDYANSIAALCFRIVGIAFRCQVTQSQLLPALLTMARSACCSQITLSQRLLCCSIYWE